MYECRNCGRLWNSDSPNTESLCPYCGQSSRVVRKETSRWLLPLWLTAGLLPTIVFVLWTEIADANPFKAVQPGRAFDLTPFAAGSVIYLIMWSVCRPYASRERSATALNVTIALALALGMIAVNASLLFGACCASALHEAGRINQ